MRRSLAPAPNEREKPNPMRRPPAPAPYEREKPNPTIVSQEAGSMHFMNKAALPYKFTFT
ncbi:hypothetical protein [Paenibacillus algicola]|uniref:hypothetical protein n=1 Tax=Paenibacillus algicola TaxID=2565926 RepID=UPI001C2F3CBA|nr:hypothetical protein [Paenibacillus algicola]